MTDELRLRVAVLRPGDGRAEQTAELLRSLGADPLIDPMLATEATGAVPRSDADYVLLTSGTGVDIVADADWDPGSATVGAIGEHTADALRDAGYRVGVVPAEHSSSGLVDALADDVAGARVEVARSDHGSSVLPDGLTEAGAYVHETVLYRLVRPPESGTSIDELVDGALDAVLFTSPLTVDHFFEAATDRGTTAAARTALNGADVVVGAIGAPTRDAVTDHGVTVDVRPDDPDIEALATQLVETAAPTHHQ